MMIPAFEAATQEMFSQVDATLERRTSPRHDESYGSLDSLFTLMHQVKSMVEDLSDEVAELKPPKQEIDYDQITRDEILSLLQKRDYESAFTKAVSEITAEMALFVCKRSNLADVLGDSKPVLSQPILLCLMQQLGALLNDSNDEDLHIELTWLQEIALTLDPAVESIKRHVPQVLAQLRSCIEDKMKKGDPALRRPLQMLLQVIRGMQR
jgi:hypothetical protein